MEWSDLPPNSGLYSQPKLGSDKMRIISDCSLLNDSLPFRHNDLRLFRPDNAKCLIRRKGPTFFYSFDISNFFHSILLPDGIRLYFPIVYKITLKNGEVRSLTPLRCVFGANYSPALTNIAISDLLGQDDSVYHKGVDCRPPDFIDELEISAGQYVDDFIDASKVKGSAFR